MPDGSRIADVESVPEDTTLLFTVRDVETDETREAILVRYDGGEKADEDGDGDRDEDAENGNADEDDGEGVEIAGWFNNCQHFTHIMLDKGSGAEMRNGEILCTNHGAMFAADTGECTFGPCEGAFLEAIDVRVEDGDVYLVDPDLEFVRLGAEHDDLDLTSTSNVEF